MARFAHQLTFMAGNLLPEVIFASATRLLRQYDGYRQRTKNLDW